MQLGSKPSLRATLTAITATLLGSGAARAVDNNRVESSILLYSETNRVKAAEGIFSLTRVYKGERVFNAKVTLDGLTGASPNGATPSRRVQTFTRPSGGSSYSVQPSSLPLDDTFRDSRYSFDGSLSQPINDLTAAIFGVHASAEHDYTSLGANVGFTRDLNRKNTTLAASVSASHDIVRPMGGAPIELSTVPTAPVDNNREQEGEDEHEGGGGPGEGKNVFDAVLGVTQILNRKTLVRFNYSFSHYSGYLNDPYKLLSIVRPPGSADPGEPVNYVYEARPDNHTKHAVYGELRRYLGGHTISLAYRYFWDSWGITSNTFDFHYYLPLSSAHALLPHFRWYRQNAADFYRPYLLEGAPLPVHASADYRLAPFTGITIGLQYMLPVAEGTKISFGGEYYRQMGDLSPPKSMGILSQGNLFPDMDAFMLKVGFSRDF